MEPTRIGRPGEKAAPEGYAGNTITEAIGNELRMELSDVEDKVARLEEALGPILRQVDTKPRSEDVGTTPVNHSPILFGLKAEIHRVQCMRLRLVEILERIDL